MEYIILHILNKVIDQKSSGLGYSYNAIKKLSQFLTEYYFVSA